MKSRDSKRIDLICSIAELSGLFQGEKGTKRFLVKVVRTVSSHMKSDVCSIYLYNEKMKELNLVATEGLNRELTGHLTLKYGEGLVGTAMKEMRTILEADGTVHPRFKKIENSYEENYKAFLAVPITRGLNRIGVLVLQHSQKGYFDQMEARALEAIAGQLAATLENARLLMDISIKEQGTAPRKMEAESRLYSGEQVVEGIALGRICHMDDSRQTDNLTEDDLPRFKDGVDNFRIALKDAETQLLELQEKMEEELSDIASMIFSAHLLMLQDEAFSGQMEKLITQGIPACFAVDQVVDRYVKIFSGSENVRLQEKVQDVKDLGHRLLRNLSVKEQLPGNYRSQIIIARELLPSELLKLTAQKAEGLVLLGQGASAHISILAKSLGVPLIYIDDEEIFSIPDDTETILDANQGNLLILPDEETKIRIKEAALNARDLVKLEDGVKDKTFTSDGTRVYLRAAINLLNEVKTANRLKAEGVGLYRSEFPFLIRNDFPSEEEQYRVYKKVVEGIGSGPVTLRTLDVGGDKILSYMPDTSGDNPFLGLRAIRFLLKNKKVFVGQLKAMLRAGEGYDLRILFPLISSVDDYRAAVRMVKKSMEFLERDGLSYNKNPKLGIMIELPSAVMLIDQLTLEADFLSIGTNDLVQYLLGVDRTNSSVASFYQGEHPAVLRALKFIVEGAQKNRCSLSVCGNLTSDRRLIYFFIGVGIQSLSVEPHMIPGIQDFISKIDSAKAQRDAEKLLTFSTLDEVKEYLELVVPK